MDPDSGAALLDPVVITASAGCDPSIDFDCPVTPEPSKTGLWWLLGAVGLVFLLSQES